MAELGIAASVVSIVAFALDLSKKLYEFSATTSAAGEEVSYIAKNITNYADVLEILAERLDADGDPIHSKHTVKTVLRLYDESCDLFDRIEDMIPEPKSGRDDLTFVQKITWNFKKGRVEFLAGQIECLKSTVSLIATILFAGRKIRSRRRSRRDKSDKTPSQFNMDTVRQRVKVAIVEQAQAAEKLPHLQEEVMREFRKALSTGQVLPQSAHSPIAEEQFALTRLDETTNILRIYALPQDRVTSDKLVLLKQSDDIFFDLLQEFTNIDIPNPEKNSVNSKKNDADAGYKLASLFEGFQPRKASDSFDDDDRVPISNKEGKARDPPIFGPQDYVHYMPQTYHAQAFTSTRHVHVDPVSDEEYSEPERYQRFRQPNVKLPKLHTPPTPRESYPRARLPRSSTLPPLTSPTPPIQKERTRRRHGERTSQ